MMDSSAKEGSGTDVTALAAAGLLRTGAALLLDNSNVPCINWALLAHMARNTPAGDFPSVT